MLKDEVLLNKELELLPDLTETKVRVSQTIHFEKKSNGDINVLKEDDYNSRKLKKGDKICLDFGDHQVGYLTLSFRSVGSHADAPVWLKLHFAENPAELYESVEEYHGWICSSWIEEEQIHVDVIPSEVRLERRYAFRYVEIEVLDISSKFELVVENAVCTAVSSADDKNLRPYHPASSRHRTLDQIACRTLHNCMQKVFEDGPKRDRRLWMGDLRMQALANYETYQNNDLVKACLYLFASLPLEDGRIGASVFLEPVPEVDDMAMFDYSLFFVTALLDYYKATGDKKTLEELWPTALSQIYIAETSLNDQGAVKDSDVLGWCFVDWNLNLNKQASAQGIFLYAIKSAICIAQILDQDGEARRLEGLHRTCLDAANSIFWDDDQEVYISGDMRQVSYASQVWMILGGAIKDEDAVGLLKRIDEIDEKIEMVTPYMYHNYIDALLACGEKQKALGKLEEYWGGMADQGTDTFWELYNPQNPHESPYGGTIVNSYCHAWSCAPAYFLRKYFNS